MVRINRSPSTVTTAKTHICIHIISTRTHNKTHMIQPSVDRTVSLHINNLQWKLAGYTRIVNWFDKRILHISSPSNICIDHFVMVVSFSKLRKSHYTERNMYIYIYKDDRQHTKLSRASLERDKLKQALSGCAFIEFLRKRFPPFMMMEHILGAFSRWQPNCQNCEYDKYISTVFVSPRGSRSCKFKRIYIRWTLSGAKWTFDVVNTSSKSCGVSS